MQIRGPQSPTGPSAGTATAAAGQAAGSAVIARHWRPGQILQATVSASPPGGPAILSIDGQPVSAPSAGGLVVGQALRLAVIHAETAARLRLLDALPGLRRDILSLSPPGDVRWRNGQVVEGHISVAGNDAPTARLRLADGRSLPLHLPPQALREGQALRLQVVDPGQPAALRVLAETAADGERLQALRNALPRQLPLASVLGTLQAAIAGHRSRQAPLPVELHQGLQQFIERLPQRDAVLRGEGLRQAIANSGLFLEARLAEALRAGLSPVDTGRLLAGDLKGGLLGLLSLLLGLGASTEGKANPAPPTQPPPLPNAQPTVQPRMPADGLPLGELPLARLLQLLQRQVDGGLARLQLSQLASHGEEDDTRHWLLDLPLRNGEHIDLLQLRIEEEKGKGRNAGSDRWSASLVCEPDGLGPVHAHVSLADGLVSARLWAEEATTAALFTQHMGDLQRRLQDAGLKVGTLTSRHGAPAAKMSPPDSPQALLDEKA